MIRVYGDLGNLDPRGRAILVEVEAAKTELREGLRVLVWDGDYEAEGVLEFSEGHWRARTDWETAVDKETGEKLPERFRK